MDTKHDIALEELYIPSKRSKDDYLCEDFIIYPDGKEQNGGYVFGIIEIRATPVHESEKVIKIIVNTLKEKYYGQINASPDPQKLNLETVFEYALQKTNDALVELIQISHLNFPLDNLNYVIAVAKPNAQTRDIDFFFTHQGLINVSLLHKTKQNNFKLINVVDNTPKIKDSEDETLKFFSSTLAGKIYYHDAVFISTELFNNFIPPHKVNKILSGNDLPTAMDYFKTLINNSKNNSYLTYASIFIKMEEKRAPADKPVSQRSMDNLISTKEKTEKYLTPTFALNIRDFLGTLISRLKPSKKDKNLQGPRSDKKLKFGVLKYIFNAFKIIFLSIGKLFSKIINLFKNKEKLSETKTKVFALHKYNKTILVAILVLVVVLVSSIFWVRHRQEVKREQAIYAEKIRNIQDMINEASVNLIYNNNAESLKMVKSAEAEIQYLPQATANQQANFDELSKQAGNIKGKLLNIEKVVPKMLGEVMINDSPQILITVNARDANVYAATRTNSLFKLSGGTTSTITSSLGDFYWSAQDEAEIVYITNQNKVINLSENNLDTKSISWADNFNLTSFRLYNGNIYALDQDQGQIYKHSGSDGNFGAASAWLKDKGDADFTLARDLAIDGNIYVLTQHGTIYKFFGGNIDTFQQGATDPEFTNASKILTTLDLDNIYVLENKRIVIYNKDGSFIKQLQFDSLPGNILDFTVTGKDEKILIVSANKVYEADLK